MKTQIFIAAGGKGTRLGVITARIPKSMVPVSGRPIIDHIIAAANVANIDQIVVGVDDGKEDLRRHVSKRADIQEGCSEPLTKAFLASASTRRPEVIIGVNGDTVYHPETLEYLLGTLDASPTASGAVLLSKVVRPIDTSSWHYWSHRFENDTLVAMDEVPGHVIATEYVMSAYRVSALYDLSQGFSEDFKSMDVPFKVYSFGWDYLLRILLWKGHKVAGRISDDLTLNINYPHDIKESELFFNQPSLFRWNRMTAEGESTPRVREKSLLTLRNPDDTERVAVHLASCGLEVARATVADTTLRSALIVEGPGAFHATYQAGQSLIRAGVVRSDDIRATFSRSSFEREFHKELTTLVINP